MKREPRRHCPDDGTLLIKETSGELIFDRCGRCEGVWLDAGELEALKAAANEEGMAIGMIIS
jgi:Zn-finger nucleic acid-binding protein